MTPVLSGRWQSRIFLMVFVGVPVTLIFGAIYKNFVTPLAMLGYMLILGLVLDVVYDQLQTTRWDNDWPPFLHFLTGVLEGATIWIIRLIVPLPGVDPGLRFHQFFFHYLTLWVAIFIVMWGFMKVFFIRWRFRGGRIF